MRPNSLNIFAKKASTGSLVIDFQSFILKSTEYIGFINVHYHNLLRFMVVFDKNNRNKLKPFLIFCPGLNKYRLFYLLIVEI